MKQLIEINMKLHLNQVSLKSEHELLDREKIND
jgi:hypothetical protein